MNETGPILVAEDDPNDALLFQCALSKSGLKCPVFFVPDGQEAKNYLLGLPPYSDRQRFPFPEMLVLDLAMPKIGGMELLEWTREQPELSGLFVVVLTGLEQRSWMTRAYELGANLYMVKPLRFSELAGAIVCAAHANSKPQQAGALVTA